MAEGFAILAPSYPRTFAPRNLAPRTLNLVPRYLRKNLLTTHLAIGLKLRIAKRAAQVATSEADEDSSTTRVASLTLQ